MAMRMMEDSSPCEPPVGYVVTGSAAHGRVGRLLRDLLIDEDDSGGGSTRLRRLHCGDDDDDGGFLDLEGRRWIDRSPYARRRRPGGVEKGERKEAPIAFLWENAPRSETRGVRDNLKCYSHLPNGILLDDKWALARLMRMEGETNGDTDGEDVDPDLAILGSHCFRGADFSSFAERAGLLSTPADEGDGCTGVNGDVHHWEDLLSPSSSSASPPPPPPRSLWVIKDAMSNGAGGIWIVDASNARDFLPAGGGVGEKGSRPARAIQEDGARVTSFALHPAHRYVAQRYAWPPVLHGGRKCHVRVYGLITCDGRAFVHRKAFLHVANEPFQTGGGGGFEPSVHITNCCANSHDANRFAGEICADLEAPGPFSNREKSRGDAGGDDVPLGDFLPSVSASVAVLARRFGPFVRGGEANGGFEYLGLDFVLSSVEEAGKGRRRRRPVAYLLEVNAPPSQDTATGLPRAENVHDQVISDLLAMWVLPRLGILREDSATTGWRCVHTPSEAAQEGTTATSSPSDASNSTNLIVPSKAAILNRIRWALFERRVSKLPETNGKRNDDVAQWLTTLPLAKSPCPMVNVSSVNLALSGSARTNRAHEDEAGDDLTQVEFLGRTDNNGLDTEERRDNGCKSISPNNGKATFDTGPFVACVRSCFPYFLDRGQRSKSLSSTGTETCISHVSEEIFFESGGGAQVPKAVSDAVVASMLCRDRSVTGTAQQEEARVALLSLLFDRDPGCGKNGDGDDNSPALIMGANATSLLDQLARRIREARTVVEGDEIVIASENHMANVSPWLSLAEMVGATVKWWSVADASNEPTENIGCIGKVNVCPDEIETKSSSCILSELITERTMVVAVSHVSNILGTERDIWSVCDLVRRFASDRCQLVVDGVAAAPHLLPTGFVAECGVDCWYAVSLHKLFGPHMGCLVGKGRAIARLTPHATISLPAPHSEEEMEKIAAIAPLSRNEVHKSWEMGTTNYEACSGAIALKEYFEKIAVEARGICIGDIYHQSSHEITSESLNGHLGGGPMASCSRITIARMCIQRVENQLLSRLFGYFLECSPLVRVVRDTGKMKVSACELDLNRCRRRIPIVCFMHVNIPSSRIVEHCRRHGVLCRASKFLSTKRLWGELGVAEGDDVVRFSLAHYNTLEEIDRSIGILEMVDGWSVP